MAFDTTGRVLLILLAIVGLALVAPAVSAHGNETAADDAPPYNEIAEDRATWIEGHMGPGSVEWMEDHMGLTVEEMAQVMADDGQMGGYAAGGYGVCH